MLGPFWASGRFEVAVDLCEGARLRLAVTVLGRLAGSKKKTTGLVHSKAELCTALRREGLPGLLCARVSFHFRNGLTSGSCFMEDAAAPSFFWQDELQTCRHAKMKSMAANCSQHKFMAVS